MNREYQDIADLMTGGWVTVTVDHSLRRGKGGGCSARIPGWVLGYPIEYQYYYVIHEVCHCLNRQDCRSHGKEFKKLERCWLVAFGLVPVYGQYNRKRYATILKSAAGPILWER